jgi:hypothetical protein
MCMETRSSMVGLQCMCIGDKALDLFDQMKQQGSANLITLLHFELFH